jgi:glycosyltransferase involved in cell wall biosynthesis
VPLVCSDIPENKQVFADEESLYFKTGDEADLAEKLNWVFSHPQEAQAIADKGYDRLLRDYNWERLSERYARLYYWLIDNKKPLNREDVSAQGL